jgi:hypothetical protein
LPQKVKFFTFWYTFFVHFLPSRAKKGEFLVPFKFWCFENVGYFCIFAVGLSHQPLGATRRHPPGPAEMEALAESQCSSHSQCLVSFVAPGFVSQSQSQSQSDGLLHTHSTHTQSHTHHDGPCIPRRPPLRSFRAQI